MKNFSYSSYPSCQRSSCEKCNYSISNEIINENKTLNKNISEKNFNDYYNHIVDKVFNEYHDKMDTCHYAIFLDRKKRNTSTFLSLARNYPNETNKGLPSFHAEYNAINKLLHKPNKPKQVDLLVIRITKSGILGNSRPCKYCLEYLKNLSQIGINIKNVYYSNEIGCINREGFIQMFTGKKQHVSSGYRRTFYKKNK